ncbi:unnamed protein product [Lampetra fluviatilis]
MESCLCADAAAGTQQMTTQSLTRQTRASHAHEGAPWRCVPRLAASLPASTTRALGTHDSPRASAAVASALPSDLGMRLRKGPDPEGDGAMKSARVEEETMADDDYDLAELTCHGFYFGFVARSTEGRAL